MPRPLRDRLLHELRSIREELAEDVRKITDLDYAPVEGMKTYRALLKEIGAMEYESATMLREGRIPDWKECEARVQGESAIDILQSLAAIREVTLSYLDGATDKELHNPRIVPDSWAEYFGDKELEAEELLRWVARHEYYHHGQIVSYRWIQGFNPYAAASSH